MMNDNDMEREEEEKPTSLEQKMIDDCIQHHGTSLQSFEVVTNDEHGQPKVLFRSQKKQATVFEPAPELAQFVKHLVQEVPPAVQAQRKLDYNAKMRGPKSWDSYAYNLMKRVTSQFQPAEQMKMLQECANSEYVQSLHKLYDQPGDVLDDILAGSARYSNESDGAPKRIRELQVDDSN